MNKIAFLIKSEKLFSIIKSLSFYFLLSDILCWPILSYISFLPILVLCNIIEYSTIGLAIFLFFLIFLRSKNNYVFKPILIFVLMTLYCVVVTLFLSKIDFDVIRFILKLINCISIYFLTFTFGYEKKKLTILAISFSFSVFLMFVSSIFYNLKTPGNLLQAFTGGRYRLGMLENQPNGYGLFCIYSMIMIIYLAYHYEIKWFYLLALIPFSISFGTQSKKTMAIGLIVISIALILFIKAMKNKKARIVCLISIGVLTTVTGIILVTRTNIFSRLFSFGDNSDGSTFERISMFSFAARDTRSYLIVGHGLNTFVLNFYRSYGTAYANPLIFHSSIGDLFYSSGIIGVALWLYFLYTTIIPKSNVKKGFFALLITFFVIQIIIDFTSQTWYNPSSFFMLGFVSSIKLNESFLSKKVFSKVDQYYQINI